MDTHIYDRILKTKIKNKKCIFHRGNYNLILQNQVSVVALDETTVHTLGK